jgi:transcription factor TFIIIB component B''
MLPILPVHSKKKKKTIHRPRPQAKKRCVQKPGLSVAPVAPTTETATTSTLDEFCTAFLDTPAPQALLNEQSTQSDFPLENSLDLESNELSNDQALVLAAEAAAALLDVDVGESIDAAALLGVEESLAPTNAPNNILNDRDDETMQYEAEYEIPIRVHDDASEKMPPLPPVPALPPLEKYSDGPLGPGVKTFTSDPPKAPMSCVHSNFLQYYYGNEAVGVQHALTLKAEEKKDDDVESNDSREAEKEKGAKDKVIERMTLKNFCSKYPKRKEEKVKEETVEEPQANKYGSIDKQLTETNETSLNNTNETEEETTPQVEIIDGEIVVRPSTLFPNSQNRVSTNAIDAEFGTAIEEDESNTLGIIKAKYDSYTATARTKPNRWSVEETKAFYTALRQCGSDFSMMQMFLPGRTRSQLKNKFKTESRRHPRLVDMALNPKSQVKLDLSVFGELEIPEEVTPITVVQPTKGESVTDGGETFEPGAKDVIITETQTVDKEQTAVHAEADMERIFDHLFDDINDVSAPKRADETTNTEAMHLEEEKEPALLLAPVPKPKVKKTKKFKAKPLAKKVVVKK